MAVAVRPAPPDRIEARPAGAAERGPARARRCAPGPLVALGAVVAVATVALARLAHGAAARLVLADGDTLTLPLLWRSAFEPGWHPVMSTQLFAFPELPLYALCASLTGSTAAALLAAGALNAVLFTGGVALVARQVLPGRGRRAWGIAAAATCEVLVVAGLHGDGATGSLLLTTYYDGVLLAAPLTVGLALVALARWRTSGARSALPAGAAWVGVVAATTWSDGLYDLWVALPLIGCLVLCALRRAVSRLELEVLVAAELGAVVVGEAVRRLWFSHLLVRSELSYVHPGYAGSVVSHLASGAGRLWSTPSGAVDAVVVAVALGAAASVALAALRRRAVPIGGPESASARPPEVAVVLPAAFAVVAPVTALGALLVVGTAPARYLAPVVVLPSLAMPAAVAMLERTTRGAGALSSRRHAHLWSWVALVASLAVATVGVAALTGVDPARSVATPCLDAAIGSRGQAGVAGYGVGRALDVYDRHGLHVLQVEADLSPYPWLVDLGEYRGAPVSFAVIDPHAQLTPAEVTAVAGPPVATLRCPGFDVLRYRPGSPGAAALTAAVAHGLVVAERATDRGPAA